jgi:hypothetical protein
MAPTYHSVIIFRNWIYHGGKLYAVLDCCQKITPGGQKAFVSDYGLWRPKNLPGKRNFFFVVKVNKLNH